ncbi:hypothetical protein CK203_058527 [Vitis vinifera]|uniref:Cysteine-rich transmembrane domain-containing protein n=1 Tax=Vitis vinifera TaxID=29760 RepID=A0A438FQS0_VITVI|nr:hypothetical protein CK203_058527 [Vitis vinifera]
MTQHGHHQGPGEFCCPMVYGLLYFGVSSSISTVPAAGPATICSLSPTTQCGLSTPRPPRSYPPPVQGYPQAQYVAPPPVAYPMKNGHQPPPPPARSNHRGSGFCRGCCAALCCCCLLDMCF